MGRATILSKISTFILTGGRRTTASGTRDVLTEMADSYVSAIYDTAANFTANNPILETKQHGVETDALTTLPKFKIGDGVTAWNDLPYAVGISILNSTYMLTGINSDISGYKQAVSLNNFVAGGLHIDLVAGVSTTPTLLQEFATNSGFPNTTIIPSGNFSFHFETKKSAGSNNYYCYAELYKRDLSGTETLIVSSDSSSQSSINTNIQHTLGGFAISNIALLTSDRLVMKVYAVMVSSTATISLLTDDNTDARFVIPSAYIGGGDFVKKGTLTTNYIPKATSSDTIGDSAITENGSEFSVNYGGQSIFYADATESFMGLSTNEFVDVIAARTEIKHPTEIKLNSPVINTPLLTASQIVGTDANKNLVSVPFGTTAGTVLEGNALSFVTPEMYGAVGDGVANDTTAIQNAINSGRMVLLSNKTYLVSSTITITDNVRITGHGYLSNITTTTNAIVFTITGNNNTFDNFRISGNSAGGAQWGIVADGVAGLTSYRINNLIYNCWLEGLNTGVVSRNMVGMSSGNKHEGSFTISDCIFTSNACGFRALTRGEYNTLVNNKFNSNTIGIELTGGNNSISGGHIVDSTTAISFISGTNDGHAHLNNVKVNHNTTAISGTRALNWTFVGCQFFANNISLTSAGKTIFVGCEFSMSSNTLTITSSPVLFNACEFYSVPGTYTLSGVAPILNYCFTGTAKLATPKVSYNELNTFTTNGTFSVPAAMAIESITFFNTTANAVTGGIKIGTTNGGIEVVVAQSVGASEIGVIKDAAILKNIFSGGSATTLYIQAVTAWNSASVNLYIKLKPLL